MATYKQIQIYVKEKYDCSIKTCWIADLKEQFGISIRTASNRSTKTKRVYPCPVKHKGKIIDAFNHFEMVK